MKRVDDTQDEFGGCGMLWLDGYGINLRCQQEFITLDVCHLLNSSELI